MNYKITKNKGREALKGFKGNIYGFLALALAIQFGIIIAVNMMLGVNTIVLAVVNVIASAIILPTTIIIVKFIIENKRKASYKDCVPDFKIILSSIGILTINKIVIQAVTGMVAIPIAIVGFFVLVYMPEGAAIIFALVVAIIIVVTSLFTYIQGLLGLCILVEGGSFKDAMTISWSVLFKNFKLFLRGSLIMLPVSILTGMLVVGMIIAMVFMMVDPIVGMLVLAGVVLIIGALTAVVGAGLLPKLLSIVYIAYMESKKDEKIMNQKMNLSDTMEHTNFDFKESI